MSDQTAPPVIEITGLHKSFGDLHVLRGVDMRACGGDVVSLIGSSGSGKSTLLRCANLLEDSQQGRIAFEGEEVRWKGQGPHRQPADSHQVRRIRTNLSMVFQQFNLWAHMTILQNVMEAPVTVLGRDKAEVEQWKRRGPIHTFSARLKAEGKLTEGEFLALDARANAQVQAAVEFAEAAAWEPVEDLLRDVVAPT